MNKQTLGDIEDPIFGGTELDVNAMVDITADDLNFAHIKALAPYLAYAENIHECNQFTAPMILGKLSVGLRKSGDYLAIAKYRYKKARADRKRIEAVCALDEFPKYVSERKRQGDEVKSTDANKTWFINQHKEVIKAIDREAFFEAVQEQLYTMKTELFMSITTARNIVYGFKDGANLSAVATSSDD